MEKYDSAARKQRRIGDSVCFWDGKPVYVKASSPWRALAQPAEDEVYIQDLEKMDESSLYSQVGWNLVKYTDEKFDASAKEMGYCNYGNTCGYAQRAPSRQPVQGIQAIKGIQGLFGKPFYNMLMNIYPTFDEAMKQFKDEGRYAIAFSRDFAIQRLGKDQITLQFHDRPIGIWKDDHFDLFPGREAKLISPELNSTGVKHVVPNH